jgi:hypothetical protein
VGRPKRRRLSDLVVSGFGELRLYRSDGGKALKTSLRLRLAAPRVRPSFVGRLRPTAILISTCAATSSTATGRKTRPRGPDSTRPSSLHPEPVLLSTGEKLLSQRGKPSFTEVAAGAGVANPQGGVFPPPGATSTRTERSTLRGQRRPITSSTGTRDGLRGHLP